MRRDGGLCNKFVRQRCLAKYLLFFAIILIPVGTVPIHAFLAGVTTPGAIKIIAAFVAKVVVNGVGSGADERGWDDDDQDDGDDDAGNREPHRNATLLTSLIMVSFIVGVVGETRKNPGYHPQRAVAEESDEDGHDHVVFGLPRSLLNDDRVLRHRLDRRHRCYGSWLLNKCLLGCNSVCRRLGINDRLLWRLRRRRAIAGRGLVITRHCARLRVKALLRRRRRRLTSISRRLRLLIHADRMTRLVRD